MIEIICNWYDDSSEPNLEETALISIDKSVIYELLEYVKSDPEVKHITDYQINGSEGLINYTNTNNQTKFVDFYEKENE